MSNIVEPQITETKPSKFNYSALEDIFKNSIPFVPPFMQKPAFQQNNGEPYVFLKDFSYSPDKKIVDDVLLLLGRG